nr:uncharacterized protein LOC116768201 [Danaus plexippus plexippus]
MPVPRKSANKSLLRRPQRAVAIRAIRGYRTVACVAACALAGSAPWDLEARVLAEIYHRVADIRRCGDNPIKEQVERWRRQGRIILMRTWEQRLMNPTAGHRVVEAIRPILDEWVCSRNRNLTFRMVQVLTGHGCFGHYLFAIGREPSKRCHHCVSEDDTAQHTLAECPAWEEQRRGLRNVVGTDLSLPTIMQMMVRNRVAWAAMASFCEKVMSLKEADEREREKAPSSDPIRRRRVGRRRTAHERRLPP